MRILTRFDRTIKVLIITLTLKTFLAHSPTFADNTNIITYQVQIIKDLLNWKMAWCTGDINYYMSFYHTEFQSDGLTYWDWRRKKEDIFQKKLKSNLNILNPCISIDKGTENIDAIVSFTQFFQSENLNDMGRKTMRLRHAQNIWKILSETWVPIGGHEDSDMATLPQTDVVDILKVSLTNHQPTFDIQAERFLVWLDSPHVPRLEATEGQAPIINITFVDVNKWQGPLQLDLKSRFIQSAYAFRTGNCHDLTFQIAMKPGLGYQINPLFFRQEIIYGLEIMAMSQFY